MAMAAKYEYTSSVDEWWRKVTLFACLLCISRTLVVATNDAVPTVVTAASAANTGLDNVAAVPAVAVAATSAIRKRVSIRSIDPLTRRSAVDKHFIRFGRNEHDGVGVELYVGKSEGDRFSEKSVNLRKREIFQGGLDDDRKRGRVAGRQSEAGGLGLSGAFVIPVQRLLGDHNHNTITSPTWSLQPRPLIPAECFSSLTVFGNYTCLRRLRVRQRQSRPQLRPQHGAHLPRYSVNADYIAVDRNDDYDNRLGTGKYEYDSSDENVDADVAASVVNTDGGDDDDSDNDDSYNKDEKSSNNRQASSNNSKVDLNDLASTGGRSTSLTLHLPQQHIWQTADSKDGNDASVAPVANDDAFVRTSRNKFSRNLFSRYDRGRDNFMRLGRSNLHPVNDGAGDDNADAVSEKNTPTMGEADDNEYAVQLGRDDDNEKDERDRFTWSRMKRSTSVVAATPVERFKRKYDSFLRLGRKHDANFMRLGRTEVRSRNEQSTPVSGDYDRWTRKHDNFMRLGRNSNFMRLGRNSHSRLHPQIKREKAQNFMRLGKRGRNSDIVMAHAHDTPRFTPVFTMTPPHLLKSDNFVRFDRDKSASFDGQTEWYFQPRSDSADNIDDMDQPQHDDDDTPSSVLDVPRFRRQVAHYQHHHYYPHHLNNTGSSQGWSPSHSADASYQSSINDSSSSPQNRDVVESLKGNDDDVNAILAAAPVDVSSLSVPLLSPVSRHLYYVSLSKQQSSSPPSSSFKQQEISSTAIPLPIPVPVPFPFNKR